MIAGTRGLAEILASDPRKAAMFYSRFGVTEEWVRIGVQKMPGPYSDIADSFPSPEIDPRPGGTAAQRSVLSASA